MSVEFEYVNIIYEKNIKKGFIRDALYTYEKLIQKLRESEQIVIKDIGENTLAVSDWLAKSRIDNYCFLTKDNMGEKYVLGKPLYNLNELRKKFNNLIFVDCYSEHSAWGPGEINDYDYMGYERNEKYFCLKDYVKFLDSNLKCLLQGKNIILTGDVFLCKKYYMFYKIQSECKNVVYYNILNDKKAEEYHEWMPLAEEGTVKKDDIILIYAQEYCYSQKIIQKINKNRSVSKLYVDRLKQEGFCNYLLVKNNIPHNQITCNVKYMEDRLTPCLIIMGAMMTDCGNSLIRVMLNKHHKIISMNYGLLNENLLWFCVKLAGEKSDNILKIFWKLVREAVGENLVDIEFCNIGLFNKKMMEMLRLVDRPTSQQLFVMFHLAYIAMYGKDISNVSDYIIYWEIHGTLRTMQPEYVSWLYAEEIKGLVLTNSRNCLVRAGGLLKHMKRCGEFKRTDTALLRVILEKPAEWEEEKCNWEYLEIKFEELKCNPNDVMEQIGDRVGNSFADVLIDTIFTGMTNYNDIYQIMKPVYDTYEEFLSQFDKMRIALFTSDWQKKRGYPHMDFEDFTRKELQEMYLREFRFEKELRFCNEEAYLMYKRGRQRWLRQKFMDLRMEAFYARESKNMK